MSTNQTTGTIIDPLRYYPIPQETALALIRQMKYAVCWYSSAHDGGNTLYSRQITVDELGTLDVDGGARFALLRWAEGAAGIYLDILDGSVRFQREMTHSGSFLEVQPFEKPGFYP